MGVEYSFWCNPLGYILDMSSSPFMSFLIIILITLITLLAVLRLLPQSNGSSTAQQMAMNAQAAAAAIAFQQHQQQQQHSRGGSPRDNSSFNPSRYFVSSIDQVQNDQMNRSMMSLSGHSPVSVFRF